MKEHFCKKLKQLRKQKELSQEQLAQALDITVQAVSKWECGLSYPDVETLPLLSDLLGVTIDELLRNSAASVFCNLTELPDDNTLRVVQYVGNRMIRKDDYDTSSPIPLTLVSSTENNSDHSIHIEIWGSAEIEGEISGNVNAGDGITCGDIGGDANAGDGIACGNIGGDANAGDGIACGNIGGNANAGDGITCGNIGGNANAGDGMTCEDIGGDITSCDGDIHCNTIHGSVNADGDIYFQHS